MPVSIPLWPFLTATGASRSAAKRFTRRSFNPLLAFRYCDLTRKATTSMGTLSGFNPSLAFRYCDASSASSTPERRQNFNPCLAFRYCNQASAHHSGLPAGQEFQSLTGLSLLQLRRRKSPVKPVLVGFQSLTGLLLLQPAPFWLPRSCTSVQFQSLFGLSLLQHQVPARRDGRHRVSIPLWPFVTAT